MPRKIWWYSALLAAIVVVTFIMGWRLNALPVQNWDEAIHGQVSRETVQSNNWLDLSYRGGHYFRKPPLSFWLRGVAFAIFGDNPWTLRGWSTVAGIATSVLLALWAWQLWKDRWLALLTAVVFATGPFVFFHAFRTGESDGVLVLFITLALYAGWRAKTEGRWLWLLGIATGLSVMTKSAGGLLPIPIILLDALLTRSWPYKWRDVLMAASLFLIIVVPWHLVEYLRFGSQFWKDYIGLHVIERATEQIHNQGVGTFWYIDIFFKRFFPWSAFFPFAFIWTGWRWWKDRRSPMALPLAWFVVVFVLFTVVRTKFDWYLLPLYPSAVLIVAPWLATLVRRPTRLTVIAHAVSFSGFLWLLPRTLHPDTVLRWLYPFTLLTKTSPTLPYLVFSAAAVAVLFILVRRTRPVWVSPAIGGYALGKVMLLAIGISLLTIRAERVSTSPLPSVVAAVETAEPQQLFVTGVDLYRYPAAEWYFRGARWFLNGMEVRPKLIDLSREPLPTTFTNQDVIIVRDPAAPPTGNWLLRKRIDDFRIFQSE